MRFDSAEFWLFFAAVLAVHRLSGGRRTVLVLASYAFYASWNPPFLLLLLASTALDFTIGKRLEETDDPLRRRLLLGASLAGNLGVLAYFKYVNFFLDNLVAIGAVGPGGLEVFRVDTQIPLGISFYTFQTISYSVDVYRRTIPACRNVFDFALFVAFFPQLIAGPILRAAEFLPQIRGNRPADARQVLDGVELCIVGLFKKVVIADTFAQVVDRCFASPDAYSGEALMIATFAFSAQIYCDFSGYSTMARGLAKLLGYELPENFAFPLLAGNPIDYRRGWHVTMGAWFRDYLYRPLGGDRGSMARVIANTMITWTAFGLWHGASWTFVLWGAYNGLLLSAYRLLKAGNLLPGEGRITTFVGYATMPFFIAFANIFFRAESLDAAQTIISRILSWSPGELSVHPAWGLGLVVLYGVHWLNKLHWSEPQLHRHTWPVRIAFVAVAVLSLSLFAGSGDPFYYFQF